MADGRSSSRKGEKSSSSRPKKPQRGLGVAQLEKMRLHGEMAAGSYFPSFHHQPSLHSKDGDAMEFGFASSPSSSTYAATPSPIFPLHPNNMMAFGEANPRIDVGHGEVQPSSSASTSYLNHYSGFPHQYSVQQPVALPLLQQTTEDSTQKKRRHDRHRHSMGSTSHNSDSSDTQELDLDLKLSL